jgi:hypothetical protein
VQGQISLNVVVGLSNYLKKSFKDSDVFATFFVSCALVYKKAALEHLKNQQQQ